MLFLWHRHFKSGGVLKGTTLYARDRPPTRTPSSEPSRPTDVTEALDKSRLPAARPRPKVSLALPPRRAHVGCTPPTVGPGAYGSVRTWSSDIVRDCLTVAQPSTQRHQTQGKGEAKLRSLEQASSLSESSSFMQAQGAEQRAKAHAKPVIGRRNCGASPPSGQSPEQGSSPADPRGAYTPTLSSPTRYGATSPARRFAPLPQDVWGVPHGNNARGVSRVKHSPPSKQDALNVDTAGGKPNVSMAVRGSALLSPEAASQQSPGAAPRLKNSKQRTMAAGGGFKFTAPVQPSKG